MELWFMFFETEKYEDMCYCNSYENAVRQAENWKGMSLVIKIGKAKFLEDCGVLEPDWETAKEYYRR